MADKWSTRSRESSTPATSPKTGNRRSRRSKPVPEGVAPLKVEFLYDNGKIVRVDITYTDGTSKTLTGKAIDSDNPVIKGLTNIRTVIRLWYNKRITNKNGDIEHFDDEEMAKKISAFGINGKFEDTAKALGYESDYFLTDEDGEVAVDERGEVIRARPTDFGHFDDPAT